MSLNAGATLQNQKYVIQNLLHQSDFGTTYQAQHVYLEQPVVLQTLNDSLRQRSDFAQICQQFLDKVRAISQESGKARVLDCFKEGEMPFVVFELMPGQAPPQLRDWFSLLQADDLLSASSNSSDKDSLLVNAVPAAASVASVFGRETQPPVLPTAFSTATPASRSATAVATEEVQVLKLPVINKPHHSKGWLPLALIIMSLVGGLLGAGLGLTLRLPASTQVKDASTKLPHRFFSREQTFPSESEWPVSETPQLFPADPAPVEQPVYNISPATETYVQPKLQPLPAQTQVQMPAVNDLPKVAAPKPQPQPNLVDPSTLGIPDVTITNPPEAITPAAPAVPSEPAPSPAALAPEPAPPPSEPPRSEAPPIKELPVLKQ